MTPTPCNGQFIVNGDFSDILDSIQSGGEIPDANWWNSTNETGPWDCLNPSWSGTRADLFSSSMGLSGWTDGYNNYSNGNFVIDPTGDGNYAAVNVWEDTSNNSGQVELTYIEQRLSNSLVPGSTYELSFQYRRAEVSSKTSEMGIYFTPDIVESYQIHTTDPPNALELAWSLDTSLQWHTATIPFVVTGSIPLEYITIGRKNDAPQQSLNNNQYPPNSGEYKGYYFIDDVSLILTNQPNLTFNQTFCNPTGLINLQAVNPNSNGVWSLVSGNGNLLSSTTNDVDLSYNGTGNFVIVYSYPYDNCDGSSSWYTETYNIEINNSQGWRNRLK